MKRRFTKLYLIIAISLLIGACSSLPNIVPQIALPNADYHALPNGEDIERANRLLAAGKKRDAASAYFEASSRYRSPQRERLILQAAELAAIFKDNDLAQRYLSPLNFNALNVENKSRFRFAQAQLALNDKNYRETLRILPQRVNGISSGLGSKILNARMAAAQASGDKLALVQELILQEPTLKNDYEISLNQDRVWNHIRQMPVQKIDQARRNINHPILKRWLELGYISKKFQNNKDDMQSQLNNWKHRNPNHPGVARIPAILKTSIVATVTPYNGGSQPTKTTPAKTSGGKHIAVILPLTGNLAGIGNALLKGIRDAKLQYASDAELKVYNSATSSIGGVYQTAINKGATVVIGPFSKNKVANLAAGNLPVPTLGLNYVQGSAKNLYQFGLSPADEAQQMAQHVVSRGQRRVAIVTPNSAWGKRIQDAMRTAVIERGGKVIFIENYANRGLTYLPVAETLARRKGEIDAILIAASPTQARQLYPTIRQSITDLPIYASSHVFSGLVSAEKDASLNGLIYTEIPAVLDILTNNRSPVSTFPRLYAMGMDAILITSSIEKLSAYGSSVKGKTGKIKLNRDGSLHRSLRWAQFKNGVPAPY